MAKLSATDPQTLVWSCPGIGSSVPGGCPHLELSPRGLTWLQLYLFLPGKGVNSSVLFVRLRWLNSAFPWPWGPLNLSVGLQWTAQMQSKPGVSFLRKNPIIVMTSYYCYQLLLLSTIIVLHALMVCVHCVSQQMWRSEDSFGGVNSFLSPLCGFWRVKRRSCVIVCLLVYPRHKQAAWVRVPPGHSLVSCP